METLRTPEQEQAEDIFFGQVVIIWSRWFLILSGIILALWVADTVNALVAAVIPIAALMALNFFFHGRYIMERPANRQLVFASTILDLLIVAGIVAFWPGGQGPESNFYVFYYPVILAVAFVFPPRTSLIYIPIALLVYMAVCLIVNWTFIRDSVLLESVVLRLVTMAATGALGTYYWRIQRDRRRSISMPGSTSFPE